MSFNHSPKDKLNNVTSLSLHMASLTLIAVKARITVRHLILSDRDINLLF